MERYTHWSQKIVDTLIERFPDSEEYVCAAGVSPSGRVHIGNLRDLMTSDIIYRVLKGNGKKAKLLFSWDDFDRFRKVPEGVPKEFEKYIGMSLSEVPDPDGNYNSYAQRFEREFEEQLPRIGIFPEFRYQSSEYKSGKYDDMIVWALNKRREIVEILSRFKTQGINEKEMENYYPVSVYSRFTGKDNTRVLEFDGKSKITYKCLDTGKTETIDIKEDRIVKLSWRIDWPMRWKIEGVTFEPGGKDHASSGGSYDMGKIISEGIFNRQAPVFVGYEFIGIRGLSGKMSGSSGNLITLKEILDIYEPALLRWLYAKILPEKPFDFAFDSEIIRQYNEFDKDVSDLISGRIDNSELSVLELSKPEKSYQFDSNPIPFRRLSGIAPLVDFDPRKLEVILKESGGSYSKSSIESRLPMIKTWLVKYNEDKMFMLRNTLNKSYYDTLNETEKDQIKKLRSKLAENKMSLKELELLVYGIPKDRNLSMDGNKPRQRRFFEILYQLFMNSDTGPRLPTFLWIIDRDKILNLLDFGDY